MLASQRHLERDGSDRSEFFRFLKVPLSCVREAFTGSGEKTSYIHQCVTGLNQASVDVENHLSLLVQCYREPLNVVGLRHGILAEFVRDECLLAHDDKYVDTL